MFELVVASGKGGTGKTSMVGALAECAGSAVLVDCDVDASNLHLIVPHDVLGQHDFVCSRKASIEMEQCTGCGLCMDLCRFHAISATADRRAFGGQRFDVDPLACEGCGLCSRICPSDAIRFESVVSGQWFRSESAHGPFLHARLGIAQSNSGRLVSLLRRCAHECAQERGIERVIVDGPPGIGCPVIASLTNASYLLIVTEPSLSAIHDLERLADLAGHFRIRTGILVNKWDLHEELTVRIEQTARTRGLAIHGRIPHDPAFVEAQVAGRSYLQHASQDRIDLIRSVWDSVQHDAETTNAKQTRRFAV